MRGDEGRCEPTPANDANPAADVTASTAAEHGEDSGDGRSATGRKSGKSASTLLVEMAQERYTFGVSDNGETYAVPRGDAKVVLMLRGGKTSLRGQLSRAYFTRTTRTAAQQALADALLVIEGIAQESKEDRLYLRVANDDGSLWLDLGDAIVPSPSEGDDSVPALRCRQSRHPPRRAATRQHLRQATAAPTAARPHPSSADPKVPPRR